MASSWADVLIRCPVNTSLAQYMRQPSGMQSNVVELADASMNLIHTCETRPGHVPGRVQCNGPVTPAGLTMLRVGAGTAQLRAGGYLGIEGLTLEKAPDPRGSMRRQRVNTE